MIISRTPLRMSFVGGGTDLPSFYRRYPGAVVSTAIQKYVYVTINKKFDEQLRISYSKTENVAHAHEIEHPIVREVLRYMELSGGLEITSIADVPSKGTGLGSSSSFTVGLINALQAYQGKFCPAQILGELASHIEIEVLKEPIGKQDQYAAAYGGLNLIEFHTDDTVSVRKLICSYESQKEIEDSCLVFFTGLTRSASSVLKEQNEATKSDEQVFSVLKSMADLARDMADRICTNRIGEVGALLHENWLLKKSLVKSVSSTQIDDWYERGLQAGASGGKLLGAGSGGFLLFYAPPSRHQQIRAALAELRPIRFDFEKQGSSIIFVH